MASYPGKSSKKGTHSRETPVGFSTRSVGPVNSGNSWEEIEVGANASTKGSSGRRRNTVRRAMTQKVRTRNAAYLSKDEIMDLASQPLTMLFIKNFVVGSKKQSEVDKLSGQKMHDLLNKLFSLNTQYPSLSYIVDTYCYTNTAPFCYEGAWYIFSDYEFSGEDDPTSEKTPALYRLNLTLGNLSNFGLFCKMENDGTWFSKTEYMNNDNKKSRVFSLLFKYALPTNSPCNAGQRAEAYELLIGRDLTEVELFMNETSYEDMWELQYKASPDLTRFVFKNDDQYKSFIYLFGLLTPAFFNALINRGKHAADESIQISHNNIYNHPVIRERVQSVIVIYNRTNLQIPQDIKLVNPDIYRTPFILNLFIPDNDIKKIYNATFPKFKVLDDKPYFVGIDDRGVLRLIIGTPLL
jgi:hypothetical protein